LSARRDIWRFVAGVCVAAFMVVVIVYAFLRMRRLGGGVGGEAVLNVLSVRRLGGGWLQVERRVSGVMSTEARIVAQGRDEQKLREATYEAVRELLALQKRLSRFDADSELSRLCARAHKEPVLVSEDLSYLLEKGVYWARRTNGALDITCVPLLEVYRRAAKEGREPTRDEIVQALKRLGWQKIVLDGRRVRFKEPLRLDLGALAKGFAAQKAVSVMRRRGVQHCLVEVGGEVFVWGGRWDGSSWRVGIKDPRRRGAFLAVVALKDGAVATSGNYERYFATAKGRHSHIVDPRTGGTADAAVSVSVVTKDGTDADALATAISVLGPKNGLALIERLKSEGLWVDALILWHDKEGERLVRSSGFGALEVK